MRRVLIYPVLCFTLAAGSAACSRDNDTMAGDNATARGEHGGDQVEVTGCLTSSSETNQYVLTANKTALTSMTDRAAGAGETFHYQLVGGNDLAAHVGREVTVRGTVKGDEKDLDIESKDKAQPSAPSRDERGKEVTPAIETEQEIEMKVAQLQVASVTPTGAACQIGQGQGQTDTPQEPGIGEPRMNQNERPREGKRPNPRQDQ